MICEKCCNADPENVPCLIRAGAPRFAPKSLTVPPRLTDAVSAVPTMSSSCRRLRPLCLGRWPQDGASRTNNHYGL